MICLKIHAVATENISAELSAKRQLLSCGKIAQNIYYTF